jgi:formamidopyrimidine-DNA glycosylase
MPELPEVETIRNRLRLGGPESPPLPGRLITGACLLWDRTLAVPSAQEFPSRIAGQTIRDIDRRGKFMIFRLSQDALLIHLRMSGDLLLRPASAGLAPHDRLVLELDADPQVGNLRLAFNDTRKFGRAWLVEDPAQVVGSLGPEPFDPSITAQVFQQMLYSRRRQLKPLLLDQSFLAGLGNIYTDEALHLAGLHPLRLSDSLEPAESGLLLESIRQVLLEGIHRQGASIDWVYRGGDFQNYFRVYGRKGEACPTCGAPVERILVGQRGTHFCPNCQK